MSSSRKWMVAILGVAGLAAVGAAVARRQAAKDDGGILLDAVEGWCEGQQAGHSQGDVPVQAYQVGLVSRGGDGSQLVQQRE